MSSDFAGLAGHSIATIGTVALASDVGKTIQSYSKPRRSKPMKRKTRSRKK